MGADAVWVCHTCKTVCPRGGTPILRSSSEEMTVESTVSLKGQISDLGSKLEIDNKDRIISFLDDLAAWLFRHQAHQIHIGSDYSTDLADLGDYYSETVDGKVSKITRYEAQCLDTNAFEETSIQEISTVIQACIDGRAARDGAVELYNRFSMKDL